MAGASKWYAEVMAGEKADTSTGRLTEIRTTLLEQRGSEYEGYAPSEVRDLLAMIEERDKSLLEAAAALQQATAELLACAVEIQNLKERQAPDLGIAGDGGWGRC